MLTEEVAADLVLRILQRGRLNQQEVEGKIGVRDGGINMAKDHFVKEIMSLARIEAINLADKIIGKEIEVPASYADIMDEDRTPSASHMAINHLKSEQRLILAKYQLGERKPVMTIEEDLVKMERVDRNKPAMELEGVTGLDQLSENEE